MNVKAQTDSAIYELDSADEFIEVALLVSQNTNQSLREALEHAQQQLRKARARLRSI